MGTNQCEGIGTEEEVNSLDNVDEVFQCPCGECSLESYLDKGCPISMSDSFPYLDISNLNEGDKEDLVHKLSADVSEIMKCFAELLDRTSVSLGRRRVSVQRLVMRALSLGAYESPSIQKPLVKENEMELRCSQTIDEAFIILRPHMSFFNFELLEHIINCEELCSADDRKRMTEYRSKFDKFCRRKVFEVSPTVFAQTNTELKKCKRKIFVVLVTEHEAEPNLVYVNAAKQKIATLLNLKPSTLHLHRIDIGSLILVFSVPEFVAQELFPLNPSLTANLKAGGYFVYFMATSSNKATFPQDKKTLMMEQLHCAMPAQPAGSKDYPYSKRKLNVWTKDYCKYSHVPILSGL